MKYFLRCSVLPAYQRIQAETYCHCFSLTLEQQEGIYTGCEKGPDGVEQVTLQCPRNGTEVAQIKSMVKMYFVYRCVELGMIANWVLVEVNSFNYTIVINGQCT